MEIKLGQAMSLKMSIKDKAKDMLHPAALSAAGITSSKVANSLRLNRKL